MKKVLIVLLFILYNVTGKINDISQLLEKTRTELLVIIEPSIPKDMREKKTVSHYTQTPSQKLTSHEASSLWILAQKNKKYINEEQIALERMYKLCASATIAEYILLLLTCLYIQKKQYQSAVDVLSVFIKLFPGSQYYKEARILYIQALFELCLTYEYDLESIKETLIQCHLYFKDCEDLDKSDANFISIVNIAQNLYIEIIKQYKTIIQHYVTKYSYTWNVTCLYACLQRFEGIVSITNEALTIPHNNDLYTVEYEKNMKSISEIISNFFVDNGIVLPKGKKFIEERNLLESKLYDNNAIIKQNIKSTVRNILL